MDSGWLASDIWPVLFIIGGLSLVSLLLASWACFRLVQQRKQFQALMSLLRSEVDIMSHSTIGVGQRLVDVEKRLYSTMEKQQRLEGRESGGAAISQATKLMEMGASVDDIMASCNIGRPEAELIALLHREVRSDARKRVKSR
ncbi:DUF2802 domain-containing protein [Pokkaliibacter plantistimulans]|uniref:DUF2802 domain-containing protein n=2 Tax=Pseudomonadota TaxID=1224 RepID=A0A2S5KUG9_9PROT|nr:DUF2802 domain-containing protein [Pokkaliibacter plantistimulans]PPC78388.1 DUF2802 domain-containing protein [Pokkaliibacter plantistimulans]